MKPLSLFINPLIPYANYYCRENIHLLIPPCIACMYVFSKATDWNVIFFSACSKN
jgi:hypothetical protein